MQQKKLIFNFFDNRNWKKLTDSRKRTKILSHHPIQTLLERKHKNYWNPFQIRIFLFLSFSVIWNWNDKYVYTLRSSLENHTRFQSKMGKVYTRFQTKRPKNPTWWGGRYPYGLCKEVIPRVLKYPPGKQRLTWARGCTINALLVNCVLEEVLLGENVEKKEKGYNHKTSSIVLPIVSAKKKFKRSNKF